jgi:hypothetical protein
MNFSSSRIRSFSSPITGLRRTLAVLLLSVASALATPPAGYNLVFEDHTWNDLASGYGWGPIASPVIWACHTPTATDFGSAWFTGPGEPNTKSPFSLWQGHLTITASQDPLKNHWRSGLISSVDSSGKGFTQALGYWETRLWLPAGAGVWPAFWMEGVTSLQRSKRVTNICEIDVLEAYGVDMTKAHQNVHVWTPSGGQAPGGGGHTSTIAGMTSGWHTYAVQITATYLNFFIDDVLQWQLPTPPEALEPMYCMVNLALGGGWPITNTPDPSIMAIDYIRCYAHQ